MVAEVVDGEELTSDLIPGLKQSRKNTFSWDRGEHSDWNGLSPLLVGQLCTPQTVKQGLLSDPRKAVWIFHSLFGRIKIPSLTRS